VRVERLAATVLHATDTGNRPNELDDIGHTIGE
jgi:hypothetical protein